MRTKLKRLLAILTVASFTQVACYNTYFIDKQELEKLESEVEQKEVVEVYADCTGASASTQDGLDGSKWAQNEGESESEAPASEEAPASTETASDATGAESDDDTDGKSARCAKVPVSTANPVTVKTSDGTSHRVTPFNFMMSESQLVSPEYDLLLSLNQVDGAEVQRFSTWKTVVTVAGVSAAAIGTFVGIWLLAPRGEGFSQQ